MGFHAPFSEKYDHLRGEQGDGEGKGEGRAVEMSQGREGGPGSKIHVRFAYMHVSVCLSVWVLVCAHAQRCLFLSPLKCHTDLGVRG